MQKKNSRVLKRLTDGRVQGSSDEHTNTTHATVTVHRKYRSHRPRRKLFQ